MNRAACVVQHHDKTNRRAAAAAGGHRGSGVDHCGIGCRHLDPAHRITGAAGLVGGDFGRGRGQNPVHRQHQPDPRRAGAARGRGIDPRLDQRASPLCLGVGGAGQHPHHAPRGQRGVVDARPRRNRAFRPDRGAQKRIGPLREDVRGVPAQRVEGQGHAHRRAGRGGRHRIRRADQRQRISQNIQPASRLNRAAGHGGRGTAQHHVGGDQPAHGKARRPGFALGGGRRVGFLGGVARVRSRDHHGSGGTGLDLGQAQRRQRDIAARDHRDIGKRRGDIAADIVAHNHAAHPGRSPPGLKRHVGRDGRAVGRGHGKGAARSKPRPPGRRPADRKPAARIDKVRGKDKPHGRPTGRGRSPRQCGRDLLRIQRPQIHVSTGIKVAVGNAQHRLRHLGHRDIGADQRIHGGKQDVLRLPADGVERKADAHRRALARGFGRVVRGDHAGIGRGKRDVPVRGQDRVGNGQLHIAKDRVGRNHPGQRERGRASGFRRGLPPADHRRNAGRGLGFGKQIPPRVQAGTGKVQRDGTGNLVPRHKAAQGGAARACGLKPGFGRDRRAIPRRKANRTRGMDRRLGRGQDRDRHPGLDPVACQHKARTQRLAFGHDTGRNGGLDGWPRHGGNLDIARDKGCDIIQRDAGHQRIGRRPHRGAQQRVKGGREQVPRLPAQTVEGDHRAHGRIARQHPAIDRSHHGRRIRGRDAQIAVAAGGDPSGGNVDRDRGQHLVGRDHARHRLLRQTGRQSAETVGQRGRNPGQNRTDPAFIRSRDCHIARGDKGRAGHRHRRGQIHLVHGKGGHGHREGRRRLGRGGNRAGRRDIHRRPRRDPDPAGRFDPGSGGRDRRRRIDGLTDQNPRHIVGCDHRRIDPDRLRARSHGGDPRGTKIDRSRVAGVQPREFQRIDRGADGAIHARVGADGHLARHPRRDRDRAGLDRRTIQHIDRSQGRAQPVGIDADGVVGKAARNLGRKAGGAAGRNRSANTDTRAGRGGFARGLRRGQMLRRGRNGDVSARHHAIGQHDLRHAARDRGGGRQLKPAIDRPCPGAGVGAKRDILGADAEAANRQRALPRQGNRVASPFAGHHQQRAGTIEPVFENNRDAVAMVGPGDRQAVACRDHGNIGVTDADLDLRVCGRGQPDLAGKARAHAGKACQRDVGAHQDARLQRLQPEGVIGLPDRGHRDLPAKAHHPTPSAPQRTRNSHPEFPRPERCRHSFLTKSIICRTRIGGQRDHQYSSSLN